MQSAQGCREVEINFKHKTDREVEQKKQNPSASDVLREKRTNDNRRNGYNETLIRFAIDF